MTQYESEVKQIAAPVNAVYAKLSNLENLRPFIDNAGNNDALRSQIERRRVMMPLPLTISATCSLPLTA